MLNERVLSFFEEQGIVVNHVLRPDQDQDKEPAQTNGICEWFNKTILTESYQHAMRKKRYGSIDDLQADLDAWMHE